MNDYNLENLENQYFHFFQLISFGNVEDKIAKVKFFVFFFGLQYDFYALFWNLENLENGQFFPGN